MHLLTKLSAGLHMLIKMLPNTGRARSCRQGAGDKEASLVRRCMKAKHEPRREAC
jgi:hypothetical protein